MEAERICWEGASVLVRPNDRADTTLFMVPGIGCHFETYQYIAQGLPDHVGMVVLLPAGEEQSSLEALATELVEEMLRVQPSGPYHLGGFSFGGKVAFEMAVQLEGRGKHLENLFLVDPFPDWQSSSKPRNWLERARWAAQRTAFHALTLLLLLEPARRPPHLWGALQAFFRRAWRALRGRRPERAALDCPRGGQAFHLLSLSRRYQAPFYPGKVTLFQALFQPPRSPQPNNGWGPHCEQVEGHRVIGFHDVELLRPPWVNPILATISGKLSG